MEWMIAPFKKYADFSGRARRKEYWMFFLFNVLVGIVLGILAAIVPSVFGIVAGLYSLAAILPSLALFVRRLHDIDKSGAWFFIGLVPLVGSIILLVFMCTEGTQGDNQYGPNPKAEANA